MAKNVGLALGLVALSTLSCKTSVQSTLTSDAQDVTPKEASRSLPTLDMNDVSILLPYRTNDSNVPTSEFFAELKKKAPGALDKPDPDTWAPGLPRAEIDGESFIPLTFIRMMTDLQNDEDTLRNRKSSPSSQSSTVFSSVLQDLDSVRLVGIRIDPCANSLTQKSLGEGCLPVLQTTWQLIGSGFMDDRNFHAVYWLTRAELTAIAETLGEISARAESATKGMPLEPHPVILKEGLEGQYFKGVMGIVHRYARGSKLYGFASLATGPRRIPWNLAQAQVFKGNFINIPVFATSEPARSQFFLPGQGGFRSAASTTHPTPDSSSSFKLPDFEISETSISMSDSSASDSEIAEASQTFVRNAQAINNPFLHSATNIDCSSCHKAVHDEIVQTHLKEKPADLFKYAYHSENWNLKNITKPDSDRWSLQMFSYSFSGPKISQRVINESAEALDKLIEMGYAKAPSDWSKPVQPDFAKDAPKSPGTSSGSVPSNSGPSLKQGWEGSIASRVNNDRCLDLKDGLKQAGATFQIWDCAKGNANQIFRIEVLDGETLVLKNKASGLCLDLQKTPAAAGGIVTQATCGELPSQRFKMAKLSTGYALLKADGGKLCLGTAELTRASNGTPVSVTPCIGQEWKFLPL